MKRLLAILAAVATIFVAAPAASASEPQRVVQSGNTFTAIPKFCTCKSTISGYVFTGIPLTTYERDVFLKHLNLGPDVPTAFGIYNDLRLFENPLPPVTSIDLTLDVGGHVSLPEEGDA